MTQEIEVQASSGNVFTDLGLENSDELLVKAELARKISSIITQQNMTQSEASELSSIDQLKISALFNEKLSGYSTARLFRFLNRQFKSEAHHHLVDPRIPHEVYDNLMIFSVDG